MIAVAANSRRVRPQADNRRTMWRVGLIIVIVSLLTSETVWARFLGLVGGDAAHFSDEAPETGISEREKRFLLQITENPEPENRLTPVEATVRNAAIPFTHSPVASARPFRMPMVHGGTGLTALRCLTQAVYYEAAFEPLQGRRAVAQVVLNRMMHPAFPKSVCGVVYQGVNRPVCQFSFTCDGSLARRPSVAAWQEAEAVARAALDGYVEPSVGTATHYHANYVSPYWAPKLVKLAKIGAHIFYRWPGGWGLPRAFTGSHAGIEAIPAILPRALVRKGTDTPAMQALSAPLAGRAEERAPQELRADDDVGGRLDTSKGWTASIPEPEETYHSASVIARQQAGEYDVN